MLTKFSCSAVINQTIVDETRFSVGENLRLGVLLHNSWWRNVMVQTTWCDHLQKVIIKGHLAVDYANHGRIALRSLLLEVDWLTMESVPCITNCNVLCEVLRIYYRNRRDMNLFQSDWEYDRGACIHLFSVYWAKIITLFYNAWFLNSFYQSYLNYFNVSIVCYHVYILYFFMLI